MVSGQGLGWAPRLRPPSAEIGKSKSVRKPRDCLAGRWLLTSLKFSSSVYRRVGGSFQRTRNIKTCNRQETKVHPQNVFFIASNNFTMARRSVLITGCSQGGAGEALAQIFVQNGFRVFATARSLSRIQHLEAEGIDILELNVLDSISLEKTAETVSGLTGGTLDILINNAGAGMFILKVEALGMITDRT
jgi:hypothetical protein